MQAKEVGTAGRNLMNSYDTMQRLVAAKLATVSTNGHLDTFKYARRVMFDYLWDTNPALLEVRGHSYDNRTGALVVAAPRKSFNYLENGWWKDVPLDTPVIAYVKRNGFMLCVSEVNSDPIYSTTGSTKSDFVHMGTDMLRETFGRIPEPQANCTDLYEIVHPDDPHIVDEPIGAHYLGCRSKIDGAFIPYGKLEDTYIGTLKGILAIAEVNTSEGFMCYDLHNDPDRLAPAKIKTPYYVGKKKLMRLSKKNSATMYANPVKFAQGLPEMWQDVPEQIVAVYPEAYWNSLPETNRREWLEILKGK